MIKNLVGGLFGKIVDNAEGILDKVITTDKERDEAKLALRRVLLEAEAEEYYSKPKQKLSPRKLKTERALEICIKTMLLFKRYLPRSSQQHTLD